MNVNDLNSFIETLPCLLDVMQDDMTILVYDLESMTFKAVLEGKSLKTNLKAGDSFNDSRGSFKYLKESKRQVRSIVPKGYFGVPAKGCLTPVFDEKGNVVAVVSVSKSMEIETQIEEIVTFLLESFEQLNVGVGEVASGSQELAVFIKETMEFSEKTQQKISEIDGITQKIKTISAQSNLLALNASIEAARAGEAGKGFSVVAKEMGVLSGLSKESTELVSRSLQEIKNAIDTIAKQISKTSLTAENQASATEEIAATSDEIVTTTKRLAQITQISTFEEELAQK
ncbi:methyl-accepting chemotaxis protein [Desulfosporosinus sp. FKA]|uniref:methyl-accepting chemotaxis protein n=1 Tax=Desulfosporosinus sp. FKA TaxID=1969834 RepID=UPI000B4A1E86|nr:methyl-accepting chemotaxis protein [Desulfosporosinus sp. FKA]